MNKIMKNKIILSFLLCLFVINTYAQNINDSIFIDKGIYTSKYSEYYKNPLRVEYKLYKPHHVVERKEMSFYAEEGLITATNKDFEDNVWDKGHCCPFFDFSDTEEHAKATFSYANCALQHFNLNRGVWNTLEEKERDLAQEDSLFIVVEVILDKNSKQLPTGAFIPDFFKKTIIFLSTGNKREFIFPNDQCKNDINLYEIKK